MKSSNWLMKARAETSNRSRAVASNRSIDIRKIEIAQVSSCALENAMVKTERQRSSVVLSFCELANVKAKTKLVQY